MDTVGTPKYVTIADQLQNLIEQGIYEPGDRLPSIRELNRQLGVSVNTVRESFRLLESRGVAEAVSHSGHFVRTGPPLCLDNALDVPAALSESRPREVTPHELTHVVLADSARGIRADLSAASPPPELLPARQLGELTARAIKRSPPRLHLYEPPGGPEELRIEIAKRLFRGGVSVGADQVVVTAGCLEAVFLSLSAVCKPGDAVIIESPAFFLFYQLLEHLHLRAVEVPSHVRDGVDLGALESVLSRHAIRASVLIGNFTNPMGALVPEENKRRVGELHARYGVYLIEDDMYGELYHSGPRPASFAAYSDPNLTLSCASFSKTISPTFRIGWVAAPGAVLEQVRHAKLVTSFMGARPTALGIAEYLAHGSYDRTLRAARDAYRRNVDHIRNAVKEHFPSGTTSTRPAGGMVVWVALPDSVDTADLYRRSRERGIIFAPGPIFSLSSGYRNCLRLSATRWNPDVEAAIATIGMLARAP